MAIASLDRVAWLRNAQGDFIPDGEHAWRHWCEHAVTVVARQGPQLAGCALAFPCAEPPNTFCLHKIMVREDMRGQGIGSRLMHRVLTECDRRGVEVFLTVDPANSAAVRLYTKWGFTERKFVAGYYRPTEDRLVLTRRQGGKPCTST